MPLMRSNIFITSLLSLVLVGCGGGGGQEAAQSPGKLSFVAGALDVNAPASFGTAVGAAADARFRDLGGIAVDGAGSVYVADTGNHAIRRIAGGQVTTLAGAGVPSGSGASDGKPGLFSYPAGLDIDTEGNLYVTDGFSNVPFNINWNWTSVRKVTADGVVSTFPLSANNFPNSVDGPAIAVVPAGGVLLNLNNVIRRVKPDGAVVNVTAPEAGRVISSLAVDKAGVVYFGYRNTIRKIVPGQPELVLAGSATAGVEDGRGDQAHFDFETYPYSQNGFRLRTSMVVDSTGNLYVADSNNYLVRKVAPDGTVTTVAGRVGIRANEPGPLPAALVPLGLALAGDKTLYVTTPSAVLRIDLP